MIPLLHSRAANSAHQQADHPETRPSVPSGIPDLNSTRGLDGQECLFDAFIAARTTLDDLALRLAVRGRHLSVATIAAHLTGRTRLGEPDHNVIARTINARQFRIGSASPEFPLPLNTAPSQTAVWFLDWLAHGGIIHTGSALR